jgi:hypothetical protein
MDARVKPAHDGFRKPARDRDLPGHLYSKRARAVRLT